MNDSRVYLNSAVVALICALWLSAIFTGSLIKHDSNQPWLEFLVFHAKALFSPPNRLYFPKIVGDFQRVLVETKTDPPFLIIVPNETLDVVVSWHIIKSGVWDTILTFQISEVFD